MNETVTATANDFTVGIKPYAFYQIHWKAEQLPNLYPFATPYLNEGLTVFFENEIIRKLVPTCQEDKICVASHQLRQKIGGGMPTRELFTEKTLEKDFEVLSLGRRSPEQHMIFRMNEFHRGSAEILYKVFEKVLGYRPSEPKNPIYQNHFVARKQIYHDYVGQFLGPAMDLMVNDEEIRALVNVDSGYYKLKPPFGEYAQRVKQFLGTDYVPLHAFILERCFSCWIHSKPIKVSYL